ncbi:variable surface protein [Plasmodium gonderi]|uniref:Variable surface protein n=1 Tax=Plasmodium gonderi TaxID=77519 RepID=A0A1Y1JA84_PLAGO|nr:variable surface protein [Plasmodium gonderi]GAW79406.1 variable surface protein [Plasmodium gonderi]
MKYTMTFSTANDWEKSLLDFPSHKKYEELDNVDITDSHNYCISNLGDGDEEDKRLCNKIVINLKLLKNEKDKDKQKRDCYYFQHWFHDQIKKKYYIGTNTHMNNYAAGKLFDLVSSVVPGYNIDKACNVYYLGDAKGWKEERDIHDYFENLEYIKCSNFDKSRCEAYVNYVTYIDNLYQKKIHRCCDEKETYFFPCNSSIKCGDEYNPKILLEKLKKDLESMDTKKKEEHEDNGALQPKASLDSTPKRNNEDNVNTVTPYIPEIKSNKEAVFIIDIPKDKKTMYDKLVSKMFLNIIITASVLGTIFFLFYYHMVIALLILKYKFARLGSYSRKKKIENIYDGEFEKGSSMNDSDSMFLDHPIRRLNVAFTTA